MTFIVAPRIQHIGALADVTPNHNIPQVKPTGRDRKVRFVPTTRITSPSTKKSKKPKYKPTMEEENYRKILSSPDPTALLNVDNVSVLSDASNPPPSPNMSKRRDKSASSSRAATPTTPPVAKFGGEQLVAINESGITVLKINSPSTPTLFYKGSPLDKALPPKPALRAHDSPERRGLLDATDSDSSLPTHPVLEPDSSGGESPTSFKVASSLGSTPSTLGAEFEVGTGVIIEGQIVSSVTTMDLGKAKAINAIPVRAASKDGSPIQRVQGLSSMPSNSSLNRRHARIGVGLTIRKSADAHELIMGTSDPNASPHPPRTSSLPNGIKSTGQLSAASRLARPTAASAARAAESKKSMLTPGKNFLNRASASKVSILSSANKSVASTTLSNKAGSSIDGTSASLPKSNTSTSLKGFKSRISDIFSGRRRTMTSNSSNDNKGYATIIDEEEDIILECDLDSMHSTPITDKRASKLLTTYHSSDMDAKASSTDNIRSDKKTPFMGKMSDREHSAKEQRRHERDERRVNRVTERLVGGMAHQGAARSAGRVVRGGDEPPTPPPTRSGPVGHYGEGNNAEENGNCMTEEEFDCYLEMQLNSAEQHLNEAIEAANIGLTDRVTSERVETVIRALGESIIAARSAHIAGIQLRVATANLIQSTTQRAADAREAIAAARFRAVADAVAAQAVH